jgi:hypothetical protein
VTVPNRDKRDRPTVPFHVRQQIEEDLLRGSAFFGSLQDLCGKYKEYGISRQYLMKISAKIAKRRQGRKS